MPIFDQVISFPVKKGVIVFYANGRIKQIPQARNVTGDELERFYKYSPKRQNNLDTWIDDVTGAGQVVTTPGANCSLTCMIGHWPLTCYITCILIIHGYYGTFRGYFSIFKTFILTHKYMNSAN